jgi:hypothetical protein
MVRKSISPRSSNGITEILDFEHRFLGFEVRETLAKLFAR